MEQIWRIQLLGALQLTRVNGTGIVDVTFKMSQTKQALLLARLALPSVGRKYRRAALADELWSEKTETVGLRLLRQVLYDLHKALGSDSLSELFDANDVEVCMRPEMWRTDKSEFDRAVQSADIAEANGTKEARLSHLIRATDIYKGDLLPNFHEEWVEDERARLRFTFLRELKTLSLAAEEVGDTARAINAARRLVDEEPVNKDAFHLLVRLLAEGGQNDAALREYDRFRQAHGRLRQKAEREVVALDPNFMPQVRKMIRRAALKKSIAPEPAVLSSVRTMNMPAFSTRFFGREKEIAEIAKLLNERSARFVTLVGPGGLGKTRLAVEAGKILNHMVVFVELATVKYDAGIIGITAEIASALGTGVPFIEPRNDEIAALDALAQMLETREPMLIVLDNVEHLVPSGLLQYVVDRLVARLPLLSILVTSRLPLRTANEILYTAEPLPVRDAATGIADTQLELGTLPAIALFLDRARAVRPDLKLTPENSATIQSLCERLDGIPLAIEIAAGWARTATPAEMLQRLNRRFAFLVRRGMAATDRHRSLEAVISWSYEALPNDTSRFFRQLGVFQGGFNASAAAAVADVEADLAAVHLDTLCEHNLIASHLSNEFPEEMRFTILETLREFASERQTPDERAGAERRHAAFFTDFAVAADAGLKGAEQTRWWNRLAVEIPNLRAAFRRPDRAPDDAVQRARLCTCLIHFWNLENALEAGRWLNAALDLPGLPGVLRARLLTGLGGFETAFGDRKRGQAAYAEARQLFREAGDEEGEAHLLAHWSDNPDALAEATLLCARPDRARLLGVAKNFQASMAAYGEKRGEALQGFADARRLFQECGDTTCIQGTLQEEAHHRMRWGDIGVAAELLEDVLRLTVGGKRRENGAFTTRFRLANLRRLQGYYNRSEELLATAEAQIREVGWPSFLADVVLHRIYLHCDLSETAEARARLNEWERLQAALSPGRNAGFGISLNAQITLAEGKGPDAMRLAADALRAFGDDPHGGWRAVARICHAQAALQSGELAVARNAAYNAICDAAASGDRLITARAAEVYGTVSASRGAGTMAAFLLGFAAAERDAMSIVLSPLGEAGHEAAVAAIRESTPSDEQESAWANGRRATVAEVLAASLSDSSPASP